MALSIVTTGQHDSMSARGKRYVPSPKLWGPPSLLLNVYRSFLWGKTSRKITTDLHLMPGLRMHGAIPLLTHTTCGVCRATLSFKLPTGQLVTQKLRCLLQPRLLPSVTCIHISFFPITSFPKNVSCHNPVRPHSSRA